MKKTTAQTILAAILGTIYGAIVWGLPFIVIKPGSFFESTGEIVAVLIAGHIFTAVGGLLVYGLVWLVKAAFQSNHDKEKPCG